MSYDTHAQSCKTTCVDDNNEDDDTYSQARPTSYPDFTSSGDVICPDDDDWYSVPLVTGDVLTVDLAFTQSTATQDLDLHLYKDSVDLTPCDVSDPTTCTVEHGQGGVSNEHTVFTVPAGCDAGCNYYVVVRGYDHSSNSYAIAIDIQRDRAVRVSDSESAICGRFFRCRISRIGLPVRPSTAVGDPYWRHA